MSFEIDARENGIHSLAEALRAFKEFHDDPKKTYALKDAIIRSHHALEALFKFALFKIDPVLLLEDEVKVKDVVNRYKQMYESGNDSILDDEDTVTISLTQTIRRLHDLNLMKGITDEQEFGFFYDRVRKLGGYRNRLQHFRLKADPDSLARILGGVIPRSIIIIEATYLDISDITKRKKPPFIFGLQPIGPDLDKIYPEWKEIYGILANDYDALVQNAIKAFNKQIFKDANLSITVDDHGTVGAPPYYPRLNAQGFLTFELEPHLLWEYQARSGTIGVSYSGEVKISQPSFEPTQGLTDRGIAKGTLQLAATAYLDASKMLKLPNVEKELSVLRAMKTEIQANLYYEADAMMLDWHFSVEKIVHAEGHLSVAVEIMPMGSERSNEELIGGYEATLTESSAPFSLHAFRDPDGSLREGNRSLKWKINTQANLTFV